jgi:hypothetical protein
VRICNFFDYLIMSEHCESSCCSMLDVDRYFPTSGSNVRRNISIDDCLDAAVRLDTENMLEDNA